MTSVLESSDPQLKARFYEEVGLESVYDPEGKVVEALVLNGRVGGAIGPLRTRVALRRVRG